MKHPAFQTLAEFQFYDLKNLTLAKGVLSLLIANRIENFDSTPFARVVIFKIIKLKLGLLAFPD